MNRLPVIVRQHLAALRILIVFSVICGVIYPAIVLGVSQVAFHKQANGSLVSYNGKIVGSSLLCQEFVDAKGNPLPQWFQPRPSDAINPDISPQNAAIQIARIATTRHLPVSVVQALVTKFTQGRNLGFLGEPRVDVLTLNIALAELPGQAAYNTLGS